MSSRQLATTHAVIPENPSEPFNDAALQPDHRLFVRNWDEGVHSKMGWPAGHWRYTAISLYNTVVYKTNFLFVCYINMFEAWLPQSLYLYILPVYKMCGCCGVVWHGRLRWYGHLEHEC